jgi:hypothetical protein
MSYKEQVFVDKQILQHTDLNTMSKGIVSKQDKLVDGVSIKTINGISLLGSGNIELEGSSKEYDVIIFMGQSNMAGRGVTSEIWTEEAPTILDGAGYEYRAISAPNTLSPIVEPFGKNENKSSGISESSKTGSMVTSFVNAYYTYSKTPVIAISAARGGTTTAQWLPTATDGLLADAINRLTSCLNYLQSSNIPIRHIYMAWCQGCSDADNKITEEVYKSNFETILSAMMEVGVEKMFMIRIGNCQADPGRYTNMIKWQTELAKSNDNVVLVATTFASMKDRGLMKDAYHYYQAGYNECGTQAGINSAFYVTTGKEPTMYDYEYDNLYYSKTFRN